MIHPTAKASREPIAAAFSSQYDKRGWGTEGSNPSLSSGESPANLNTSIRVDPGRPILAPKKRLVSIPAEWRQGWQGSALAPSRNPVTQR